MFSNVKFLGFKNAAILTKSIFSSSLCNGPMKGMLTYHTPYGPYDMDHMIWL